MRIKMTDLRRLIREAILSDDERVAAEKKKDDAKRVAGSILDRFEFGDLKRSDDPTEINNAIGNLRSNLAKLDITDMSDIENLRDPNKRTAAIKKIRGMLPST